MYYWIHSKKISLSFIVKSISIILTIMVLVAIIDGFSGYPIKLSLFKNARLINNRFLGLCGEPRSFGRVCSFGLLFLFVMKNWFNDKYVMIAIFMSAIGILLSLSATAYLLTIAWFIILLFYKTLKINVFIIIFVIGSLSVISFLLQNDEEGNSTITKIEMVMGEKKEIDEKVNTNEPDFFSRFEVFDRAALNFLHKNPQYIITGVGPNLINIPASPYLTSFFYAIYGGKLDSVPHAFIVNLLSRSGLIGLFLWIIFTVNMYKKFRNKSLVITSFFIATFVSNLIVNEAIFYLYIGIILPIFYIQNESNS